MSGLYSASGYVYAGTYGEAIEQFGTQMDTIWENGNWQIMHCEATPHIRDGAGEIISWKWDFAVKWLGQNKKGR